MKNTIKFKIKKMEKGYYVASAIGHFIVTQGKTMNKLLKNIKEATELYMQGENLFEF